MRQPEPKNFFENHSDSKARVAIFVSGTGTNAEKILDFAKENSQKCFYKPVCIVTDRPGRCRAESLSAKYQLPFIYEDINKFYHAKGLDSISLATEQGRQVREEWTAALYEKISPLNIDFGIFAGFIPLTNITDEFPCLNVHPGDLTACDESGEPILVGLHTTPIHKAFEEGFETLRSSVIAACAYKGSGLGMDKGIVLGISQEIAFDYMGKDREFWLRECRARAAQKPKGGWRDAYQNFLSHNQQILKSKGDWIVFPQTVNDFAAGRFAHVADKLFYKSAKAWLPVKVLEYFVDCKEIYFRT